MKKFIFGLVLFFGGCVIFGQIIIALAIIDGLYQDIIGAIWFSGLTVPFLFSLALMVYGVTLIRKGTSEKEDISPPEKQNDKYSD